MKYLVALCFVLVSYASKAQLINDLKVKNDKNSKDRTLMLDLLRAELYKYESIEMKFVVEYFKSSEEFAWFEGVAQRKDGKPLELESEMRDCCRVYTLFQKISGKWTIADLGAFCTDVCYWGIATRFPKAPRAIFPENEVYFSE